MLGRDSKVTENNLLEAVRGNDADAVTSCLAEMLDPSYVPQQVSVLGRALYEAMVRGCRIEIIDLLLQTDVDIEVQTPLYLTSGAAMTFLNLAIQLGRLDIVLRLIDKKVNVNAHDTYASPLVWAIYHKRFDIADALLRAGANVNAHVCVHRYFFNDTEFPQYSQSPLQMAIHRENLELVKALIARGAGTSALNTRVKMTAEIREYLDVYAKARSLAEYKKILNPTLVDLVEIGNVHLVKQYILKHPASDYAVGMTPYDQAYVTAVRMENLEMVATLVLAGVSMETLEYYANQDNQKEYYLKHRYIFKQALRLANALTLMNVVSRYKKLEGLSAEELISKLELIYHVEAPYVEVIEYFGMRIENLNLASNGIKEAYRIQLYKALSDIKQYVEEYEKNSKMKKVSSYFYSFRTPSRFKEMLAPINSETGSTQLLSLMITIINELKAWGDRHSINDVFYQSIAKHIINFNSIKLENSLVASAALSPQAASSAGSVLPSAAMPASAAVLPPAPVTLAAAAAAAPELREGLAAVAAPTVSAGTAQQNRDNSSSSVEGDVSAASALRSDCSALESMVAAGSIEKVQQYITEFPRSIYSKSCYSPYEAALLKAAELRHNNVVLILTLAGANPLLVLNENPIIDLTTRVTLHEADRLNLGIKYINDAGINGYRNLRNSAWGGKEIISKLAKLQSVEQNTIITQLRYFKLDLADVNTEYARLKNEYLIAVNEVLLNIKNDVAEFEKASRRPEILFRASTAGMIRDRLVHVSAANPLGAISKAAYVVEQLSKQTENSPKWLAFNAGIIARLNNLQTAEMKAAALASARAYFKAVKAEYQGQPLLSRLNSLFVKLPTKIDFSTLVEAVESLDMDTINQYLLDNPRSSYSLDSFGPYEVAFIMAAKMKNEVIQSKLLLAGVSTVQVLKENENNVLDLSEDTCNLLKHADQLRKAMAYVNSDGVKLYYDLHKIHTGRTDLINKLGSLDLAEAENFKTSNRKFNLALVRINPEYSAYKSYYRRLAIAILRDIKAYVASCLAQSTTVKLFSSMGITFIVSTASSLNDVLSKITENYSHTDLFDILNWTEREMVSWGQRHSITHEFYQKIMGEISKFKSIEPNEILSKYGVPIPAAASAASPVSVESTQFVDPADKDVAMLHLLRKGGLFGESGSDASSQYAALPAPGRLLAPRFGAHDEDL